MGNGNSPLLRGALFLLVLGAFAALFFSHSIPRMVYTKLACPLLGTGLTSLPESDIRPSDFPENFVFGVATAAYQVEGAVDEGGRGPSIWDVFTKIPGKILEGDNADVAVDQYHKYKEDVNIIKSLGMQAYRFSISWSRILPDGRASSVNEEGIAYYNRLIDALLSNGIEPYATLYHWDLPEALMESFDGWISRDIVELFGAYAEICFAAFGDRVKHWITFNEPQSFTWLGYGSGDHAPGRTSDRSLSPVGNSSTEPYLAGHNVVLSHATAVNIYRTKFQAAQGGSIGITVDCEWGEPMSESRSDADAAERRVLFQLGWFLDPLYFGDYPEVMRQNVGARLPTFSEEDKSLMRGSLDFIGLNHYTSRWVTSQAPPNDPSSSNYWNDQCVITSDVRDGVQIGERAYSEWLYIVPWGIESLIEFAWNRYGLPIYVTENGVDTENKQVFGQSLPTDFNRDPVRVEYYQNYLKSVLSAVRKGADVRSYFAWSLLDNFEWAMGYTSRFGLYYVDYSTLVRYPKDSAQWWAKFLQSSEEGSCLTDKLNLRSVMAF